MYTHALSRTLGYPSRRAFLAQVSARDLMWHMAFDLVAHERATDVELRRRAEAAIDQRQRVARGRPR